MKKTIVLLCLLQQIGGFGCYAGGGASKTNTENEHLLSAGSSKTHLPKTLPANAHPLAYRKDFEDTFNNAAGGSISYPGLEYAVRDKGYLDLIRKFEGADPTPALPQMLDFIREHSPFSPKDSVLSIEAGAAYTPWMLRNNHVPVIATESYKGACKSKKHNRYTHVRKQNPQQALKDNPDKDILLLSNILPMNMPDISAFKGSRLICIDNQGNNIGFIPDPDIWEEVSHDTPALKSFLDLAPHCATHSPPICLHLYRRKGSKQSALALSPETDLSNKLNEERFQ